MRRFFTYLFARKNSCYSNVKSTLVSLIVTRTHSSTYHLQLPPSVTIPSFSLSPRTFTVSSQLDCNVSCGVRNWSSSSVSDVAKLYEAVIENLNAYDNMEKALDSLGIPLSTDTVVGVLQRFQFEEKIAFRFFMWAGHKDNYAHEPQAYNLMIDILSSTKYKAKQFRLVCSMLDYMKRNNKTVVPIDVLLTILKQYTEKYMTSVQKFAKKKRIKVKTQPEINALNLLLDAL